MASRSLRRASPLAAVLSPNRRRGFTVSPLAVTGLLCAAISLF
ncbi:hypothetical protein A2U01_0015755 [Trifolium medium]|uniref:Uncharacterized protein n=1 Tax=Trifolium medium TaxID=97028 RepID=A0A392N718_9FABA|nr:hypothetical protein [Trifolium medium]